MKKIIDVAKWNKITDYPFIKKSGIEAAIIKIINKQGQPDDAFETHYNGFLKAGIPVIGGYNYSYATSIAKAVSDAKRVLEVADGRIAKIWLDVEDNSQKGLGELLINIINEYQHIIEGAGLQFGVYTGLSFYNSYLKPYASRLKCGFWIARYPSSSQMRVDDIPDIVKQPIIQHKLCGWQYSSKGAIKGISGSVDLNIWYDKMESNNLTESIENPYQEPSRLIRKEIPLLRGDDVKWVQYHLVRLEFLSVLNKKGKTNIDGICGNETLDAIVKAQNYFNILADRICGAATREHLKRKN